MVYISYSNVGSEILKSQINYPYICYFNEYHDEIGANIQKDLSVLNAKQIYN